jgi:tetratricopeptide (TPR) repeat protein
VSAASLLFSCLALWGVPPGSAPQSDFTRGVEAYRRGDYAEARERWEAALEGDLAPADRARVYYDLGNACWRLERPLEAVACYTAAVRLDPRHAEAWQNLEFTRAKSGLAPADAGDLGATLERALTSLRPPERRVLLFGALVLWTLVLLLELRWGGAALRGVMVGATLALALAAAPWAYGLLRSEAAAPMLVVRTGSVPLRSEPLDTRDAIGELSALEEVDRIDALPGWIRVETRNGLRGWVREDTLFALRLDGESRAM